MTERTIRQSIEAYLNSLIRDQKRSQVTYNHYRQALKSFVTFLRAYKDIDVDDLPSFKAQEIWVEDYVRDYEKTNLNTKQVYFAGIFGWYKFLKEGEQPHINVDRLSEISKYFKQKPPVSTRPRSPFFYEITRFVEYAIKLPQTPPSTRADSLRMWRDRAIILTLVETGLDVNTMCALRRGDASLKDRRLAIPVKGSKRRRDYLDITWRLAGALGDYLGVRDKDITSGLHHLPLFAQHSRTVNKKPLPVPISSPRTIQNLISNRGKQALGDTLDTNIRPSDLIEYHHTISGLQDQLKMLHPKIIENCKEHYENGLYDDAILAAMRVLEVETRSRAHLTSEHHGANVFSKSMASKPLIIKFSDDETEQKYAHLLYLGAFGWLRNPRAHKILRTADPVRVFECLSLASLLMYMLDRVT